MSYRHHYALLLPVAGMIEENMIGLSPDKVAAALRALAEDVEAGRERIEQLLGRSGPVSCEREDRWVWRAVDRPNIIRKAAGGWVEVDSTMIDLADTVPGSYAARLMMLSTPAQRSNAVWCRPEDIGGIALVAEFRDDRSGVSFGADMREFLAKGEEDLIETLARTGWDMTEPGDVLDALAEGNEPAALAILDHLDPAPGQPRDGLPALRLVFRDPQAATSFLKEARPDLHEAVFGETPEI